MNELLFALYVGPDQMLPLASVIGTLTGLVLMFWHKLLKLFHTVTGRSRSSDTSAGTGKPSSL